MLCVMTAEQFSRQAKALFNVDDSKHEISVIVRILSDNYQFFNGKYRADIAFSANLFRSVLELCDNYERKHPFSRKLGIVRVLRGQVLAVAQAMFVNCVVSQPAGQGLRGWARVRQAIAPVVSGARQGCLTLDPAYWIEAAVSEHFPRIGRRGESDPFALWSASSSQENYLDWLRHRFIPGIKSGEDIAALARVLSRTIHYGRDADREGWRISVRNGLFYDSSGVLLNTMHFSNDIASLGWAIYVRTPDDHLYAHGYQLHVFHHSVLNAGRPVMSAGEIYVRHGVLRGITNKSGHYRPETTHFLQMLSWLRHQGVNLAGVAACPFVAVKPYVFFDAAQFLDSRGERECSILPPPWSAFQSA